MPEVDLRESLAAPSVGASIQAAQRLYEAHGAQALASISVRKGALLYRDKPIRSAWRNAGLICLLRAHDSPLLEQLRSLWLRADIKQAPDWSWIQGLPLHSLRLSLSAHPLPALPPSLRSLRLDIGSSLAPLPAQLTHLELYGWETLRDLDGAAVPALTHLRLERMPALRSLAGLHAKALIELDADRCLALTDLGPLAQAQSLERVRLARCSPDLELSPLLGLPLAELILTQTLALVPPALLPITSPKGRGR